MHSYIINIIFFSFVLVSPLLIHTADTTSYPTLHNDNKQSFHVASPVWHTEIKPNIYTAATAVVDRISIKVEQITILISQTIKEVITKKNATLLKDLIKQLLWENRYKIAGGTAIGSYSAMNILLITDYYHLDNTMTWAHWKHQSTFEDLCAISQKELAKDLLLAIGEYHYNKDNPTDLAYPLVTFIKQTDWEIDIIKRYIKTVKIIKNLSLMTFFMTNDKKLDRATRALQRVLFIKHIFLSWLADYNLTSTEKLNA